MIVYTEQRRFPSIFFAPVSVAFYVKQLAFSLFKKQASLPIADRNPYANYTFAISNYDLTNFPNIMRLTENTSVFAVTQTIFIAAGMFKNQLKINVSFDTNLFDESEINDIMKLVMARLTNPKPGHTKSCLIE